MEYKLNFINYQKNFPNIFDQSKVENAIFFGLMLGQQKKLANLIYFSGSHRRHKLRGENTEWKC